MEQLIGNLKSTKSLVREHRAAMKNITTGWCSDLETRRVYSVGMKNGKPFAKLKPSKTHQKTSAIMAETLKQAS